MQLVPARLVDHVDDALATTECRRRRTRLHLELLDGVHRREEDQYAGIGIHAVDAVDDVRHVLYRRAVDYSAVGSPPAGVSEESRGSPDTCQYAGRALDQLRKIRRVEWPVYGCAGGPRMQHV